MATLKPTTPLLAPNKGALKPASPLRPKTAPKTPISHPQRHDGFRQGSAGARKGDRGFRQAGHLADRARLRCPWAVAGPGRATSGQPTLQTSSNQRDSNHLARTPVTNVVNLSPKTVFFSEKTLGLTTFVTTGQKATRKTPPIDDVCNNTHPSTPKTQHARPPMTPTGSGGPGCGGRGRRRGLAGLRDNAPISDLAPLVWRPPEWPQGQAEVPVGGGGAWPGFEATRRAKLAARTARGRAAAHRHTQRPGPPAPETPVGPQAPHTAAPRSTTRQRVGRLPAPHPSTPVIQPAITPSPEPPTG